MSGKSTIKVLKKVNKTTLDEEIAKYVAYHRYYQRLIAIRIISEGHSIAEAARIIGKSYQTVHRWAKTCESEGLEGLKPSFGGGRPSKLTYDQLIELDKIIEETPNMSMKDVHLIVNKKFDVDYSLKQIGKIVKKLGTTNDIIVLFDEASFQNEPYTQKSLYKRGTKHTQIVNPYKFKINATGSLTINGNSTITITNSSTAPEIAIALLELRCANTNNKNTIKILNKIIQEVNLTDE